MQSNKTETPPQATLNPPLPPGEGRGEGHARRDFLRKNAKPSATNKSRQLRRSETDAEKKFWSRVRGGACEGYKFRRQFAIGPYFADFACFEKKLVVEIDGGQHNENKKDAERTAFLNKMGYEVVRFWNHDVLNNIDGVMETLTLTLSRRERGPAGSEGNQHA